MGCIARSDDPRRILLLAGAYGEGGDGDFPVVATPVWARKVPPYINEYLSEITNAAGKPFSVLVEMGGWRRTPSRL